MQALIAAPISPPGDRNADLRADCGDAMWRMIKSMFSE
jgi:hypothetical protein